MSMSTSTFSLKGMPTELRKRVVTGVVGGAALLLLIIFGGWLGIFFLTTALSMGMIYEYSEMVFDLGDRVEKRYMLLCVTWFVALVNLLAPQAEFQLLVLTFLILFGYFLITARRYEEARYVEHFKEMAYCFFGIIYLVFVPLYMTRIYEGPYGVEWTILFLCIVFAGDTGAYFAGRKYGKHKLYVEISPKKTWEGSAGGLAAGLVFTILFKLIFFRNMPWFAAVMTPILVGAVAQVGDLCESFLKRAFNKKDSGTILPGHGGFLDRFDGVVFSLPIMYACIRILG